MEIKEKSAFPCRYCGRHVKRDLKSHESKCPMRPFIRRGNERITGETGENLHANIALTISRALIKEIDQARGEKARSRYIREAVAKAIDPGKKIEPHDYIRGKRTVSISLKSNTLSEWDRFCSKVGISRSYLVENALLQQLNEKHK